MATLGKGTGSAYPKPLGTKAERRRARRKLRRQWRDGLFNDAGDYQDAIQALMAQLQHGADLRQEESHEGETGVEGE